MPTTAWFHCYAGIAGDMALGSLLDAGADVDEVRSLLERLPVPGWSLEIEPVLRGGVAATKAQVVVQETSVVRTHSHIAALIEESRLPDRVSDRALGTFAALADAEGRLHRRDPAHVHFHEVGGIDAIVDIVGTCAALEILGVDDIKASAVATGTGMVRTAHGMLPNPAPAVVELLRGAPTYGRDMSIELTTPTGAALLAALSTGWGAMPAMTIERTGFGAGSRELDGLPNTTQVVIGTRSTISSAIDGGVRGQSVVMLETNVDDITGEGVAHAIEELLAAGAHDAWVTPILMKKGRPAYTVHALADTALVAQLAEVLRSETGTLGVRASTWERWPASRSFDSVEVHGVPVRVKVSPGRVKAEHEDAARAARLTGLPLREVHSRAEAVWRARLLEDDHSVDLPPDDSA
ncbi:MAG: nickel pincer cofactor biosynthesis protein LarC [Acidimicrobiales bacterium]